MTIGSKISEFRRKAGWSQGQLAAQSGVSQQLISQIENDKNRTTKHLAMLARALGKTLQEIDPALSDVIDSERDMPPVTEAVHLVSWVSAGQMSGQDGVTSLEGFPVIHVAGLPKGKWIGLRVDGTSMNKLSPPDSIIIVNLEDDRLIPGKCYVVADETNDATYKAYDPKEDPPFQPRSYIETAPPRFVGPVRVIGRVYRTMLDL